MNQVKRPPTEMQADGEQGDDPGGRSRGDGKRSFGRRRTRERCRLELPDGSLNNRQIQPTREKVSMGRDYKQRREGARPRLFPPGLPPPHCGGDGRVAQVLTAGVLTEAAVETAALPPLGTQRRRQSDLHGRKRSSCNGRTELDVCLPNDETEAVLGNDRKCPVASLRCRQASGRTCPPKRRGGRWSPDGALLNSHPSSLSACCAFQSRSL